MPRTKKQQQVSSYSIEDIMLSTPPEDLPNLCSTHSAFGQLCKNKQFVRRYKTKWNRTQRTKRDYTIYQIESLPLQVLLIFKDYLKPNELWSLCSCSSQIFKQLCMDNSVQKQIADRLYETDPQHLSKLMSELSGQQIVNLCESLPALKKKICNNDKLWKQILKNDIDTLNPSMLLSKKEKLLKSSKETIMAQYKLLQLYQQNRRNISPIFDYLIKRGKMVARKKPNLFKTTIKIISPYERNNNTTTQNIALKGGKLTLNFLNGTTLVSHEPRYNTETQKVKLTIKKSRGVSDDNLSLKDLVYIKLGIPPGFGSFVINKQDKKLTWNK